MTKCPKFKEDMSWVNCRLLWNILLLRDVWNEICSHETLSRSLDSYSHGYKLMAQLPQDIIHEKLQFQNIRLKRRRP